MYSCNRITDAKTNPLRYIFGEHTLGFAQCSMCKAVAETADGGGFGAGLNYGIVYLMIFPYLIIGGIAYKIYKNKKAYK